MRNVVVLGAVVGFAAGCWRYDPAHCGSNLGDASCGDGMFCDACEPENNGCVAEQPSPSCHVEAVDDNGDVEESSSSGGSTGESTDPMTSGVPTTEPSGTTTGPQGCSDDRDCSGAAPFCGAMGECVSCEQMSDPDGACQGLDALMPVCSGGACVQCIAERAGACAGQTPICNASNECVACTEHDHCPDSACHLDGDLVGACFDSAEVVEITNTAELSAALEQLGTNDRAVFRLSSGSYGIPIAIGDEAEVAIIGQGATPPVLNGDSVLQGAVAVGGAILYLDGVLVSNPLGSGVECAGAPGGTSLWLDDTDVRNCMRYGVEAAGECATHLRRTIIASNGDGGIVAEGAGELWVENSVVGLNGNDLTSTFGGIRFNLTSVDITYSTLIGNESSNAARGSLFCLGGESGSIRNSIIVGSGDSIDGCDALTFETSAVDSSSLAGSNPNVGAAMAGWFLDLGMNNYRLSPDGETIFADIAMWQEGDPVVDVDGEPIPTMEPSLPGYDQP